MTGSVSELFRLLFFKQRRNNRYFCVQNTYREIMSEMHYE